MQNHRDIVNVSQYLSVEERLIFLSNLKSQKSQLYFQTIFEQPAIPATAIMQRLKISRKEFGLLTINSYDSLVAFFLDHNHSKDTDILLLLRQTQTLGTVFKERQMFNEALIKITQGIETSSFYELYDIELALQYQWWQIKSYTEGYLIDNDKFQFGEKIKQIIFLKTQHDFLFHIYHELIAARFRLGLRTSPEEQKEILLLRDQIKQLDISKIDSYTCKIIYYQSELFIAYMIGKTESIENWNKELLSTWQSASHMIPLYPELFLRSVSIQSYSHFMVNIYAVRPFLNEYAELLKANLHNDFYQQWFEIINFHSHVKELHKTYDYPALAKYFLKNWPHVKRKLHVLRDVEKLDIITSASITYFVLEEWEMAESQIQEAKQMNLKIKKIDTLYFSFIFHCLILFEQKEWTRLDTLINSEYQFLYKNKTLRPFEKEMLLFIKKLPVIILSGRAEQGMKSFLEKLDSFRQNDMKKLHFVYFDFYSWIKSKIIKLSYTTYMKENAVTG